MRLIDKMPRNAKKVLYGTIPLFAVALLILVLTIFLGATIQGVISPLWMIMFVAVPILGWLAWMLGDVNEQYFDKLFGGSKR